MIYVKMSAAKWDVTVGAREWEWEKRIFRRAENAENTLYTGA